MAVGRARKGAGSPAGKPRRGAASARGAKSRRNVADLEEWARDGEPPPPLEIKRLLRRGRYSLEALARRFHCSRGLALDAIDLLRKSGVNVQQFADDYSIPSEPAPVQEGPLHRLVSDAKGHYRFGIISDTHYGSKYAREDVAEALYDWYAAEGVKRVYHAGNWIDGEARFNKYDLIERAHGLQAQLDYFVERYPVRRGVTTYYVAGDDHEGWYAQREGVDIGRMLEDTAKAAGRTDLRYLGYMEAFITLEHKTSGRTSKMLVMHPGGGSAYATSYAIQKIIEALQPGEKPGVLVAGHYHKLEYLNVRGVHCIQAGCTKDLDPFGRKKKLQYHVGGWIVDLWQDAQGGISGCRPWLRQFFDRSYYNDQFSLSGPLRRVRAPHGQRKVS